MKRWSNCMLFLVLTVSLIGAAMPDFGEIAQELFRKGRYQEAADAWAKGAKAGDLESGYRLGRLYSDGTAIGRNFDKAAHYLKPAAIGGHAQAQFEYATLLDNGWGVPKSRPQAAKYYLQAAERGVPAAMFNIGAMLENGEGIKADVVQAFKWYTLAFDRGLDPIVQGPLSELAERLKPDEMHRALDLARDFKSVESAR